MHFVLPQGRGVEENESWVMTNGLMISMANQMMNEIQRIFKAE